LEVAVDPSPRGGGLRIFPDSETPELSFRDTVAVKVKISRPLADVDVYLRRYDVDDPSANPLDATDMTWLVDDESKAADNRAPADDLVRSWGTNGMGEAMFYLDVSHFAGDNYRVVAAFRPNVFGALNAEQRDPLARVLDGAGNEPPVANDRVVQAPEILTVWRRLHVEVDSMGAVAGNTIIGTIGAPVDQ
jgi:hypothetical protein